MQKKIKFFGEKELHQALIQHGKRGERNVPASKDAFFPTS